MFVNIVNGRKTKRIIYSILCGILLLLFLPVISGHEVEISVTELSFFKYQIEVVYVTSILLGILVLISILVKERLQEKPRTEKIKLLLFILICIPIILASLYLIAGTIYKNTISETKGPVH